MKKKLLFSATFMLVAAACLAQNGVVTVNVETPGTLSELVLDLEATRIKSLTVTGNLNAADIAYLGGGAGKMSSVEKLDISNVTLVPGDEPYATVVIARSDVGFGKTTAIFYIDDTYSETSDWQYTGMGGVDEKRYIHTNDLSGAFALRDSYSAGSPIKEVILPASLPKVGDYMFMSNSNIERVTVPECVTGIGISAFGGASSLASVNIPAGVEEIGEKAFAGTALSSIVLPEGLKTISNAVFEGSSLSEVNLPASVTEIGRRAFAGAKLTCELDFSNVEKLGESAFSQVPIRGTLDLRKVSEIPYEAFDYGDYDKVIFSDKLKSIGEYAFFGSNLTDVELPASLSEISTTSFENTPWYNSLTEGVEGIVYAGDIALCLNEGEIKELQDFDKIAPQGVLTIKEGTRIIANGGWNKWRIPNDAPMFSFADWVTSVQLPSTLKTIGDEVFYEFDKIGEITLPEGLEIVGKQAFYNCKSLWFEDLPSSMVTIGKEAFRECSSLTQITLGENVKSVGENAFYKCSGISLVKILAPDLRGSGNFNFSGEGLGKVVVGSKVLYLPYGLFRNSSNLRKVEFELRDPATSLLVGADCFSSCTNAEFVNFPERIDTIGDCAFGACRIPERLVLEGTRWMGGSAFANCSSLTEVVLPESLSYIGDAAFGYCENLRRVEYNCVSAITEDAGWGPFHGYNDIPALTEVKIGKNVEKLDKELFFACPELKSVKFEANDIKDGSQIPESLEIGESCFASSAITEIELPCNTTVIGENALDNCKLTEITLPASVKYIGEWALDRCPLKIVTILSDEIPEIGGYPTDITYFEGVFRVPAKLIEKYRHAEIWKDYKFVTIEKLVEQINISPASVTFTEGEDYLLAMTLSPEDADNLEVEWKSDNENVAVVDTAGVVTARHAGVANITVSTLDGSNLSANCTVTVVKPVVLAESIFLDMTEALLNVGETVTLVAKVLPEYADNREVTWRSDNDAVAQVDDNGVVKAVAPGTATVSVSTLDGSNLSANCTVTVVKPVILAESISLDIIAANMDVGDTMMLTATVLPEDADNREVAWISGNEDVVTVDDNGVVTAVAPGTATVTVSTLDGSDLSANCVITVVKPVILAESISLDIIAANMDVGDTMMLTATVLPEDADNREVTWLSGNEDVVTVDNNGVVTAVAPGTATVTVSTLDGSNLSATCEIRVVKPVVLVESITLNVTEATMNVGDTMMLTVTVVPEDADNREVTWISGNEGVVTVDNNGVVTAVAPGTATVTVSTLDGSDLSATCNITVEPKTGGVDAVGTESVNVIARDGVIIISGTSEEAFIYSMTGMLIRRTDERRIEGLVSGCYFVFVGGQSFKVVI